MRPELVLRGVIPANLMAFDSELEIDEENYRRHLRYLVDTPGVTGITTNAHASEVATLTFEEQQRVLEMTLDEVAASVPVVCGVYQDGTSKAARIAKKVQPSPSPGKCTFMPAIDAMRVSGSTITLNAVSTRRTSLTRWEITDSLVSSRASTTSL